MVRIATLLVRSSARQGSQNHHRAKLHGRDIPGRLALMLEAVRAASAEGCKCLLLPAGFFCVSSRDERRLLERGIVKALANSPLVVALGIDQSPGSGNAKQSHGKNTGGSVEGYFGYVVDRGIISIGPVQQTGVSTNQVPEDNVAEELPKRHATSSTLGGKTIALALCGELLSVAWRDAIVHQRPGILFHPAHASVQLGGTSKESWKPKLTDLIKRLPDGSVWAFSDHIMNLQHMAGNGPEPLVRRGGGAPAKLRCTQFLGDHHCGKISIYDA